MRMVIKNINVDSAILLYYYWLRWNISEFTTHQPAVVAFDAGDYTDPELVYNREEYQLALSTATSSVPTTAALE